VAPDLTELEEDGLVLHKVIRQAVRVGVAGAVSVLVVTGLAPAAIAGVSSEAPDFVPISTSWTSVERGWVLGFAACGDAQCPRLVTTPDGGRGWELRAAPPVRLPARDVPVRVVFAPRDESRGAAIGFATDGRRLFATRDGAQTWSRVKLRGVDGRAWIGDLVATASRVYAIVGDGSAEDGRTRLFMAGLLIDRLRPVRGVETEGNGVPADGGWDIAVGGGSVAVSLGRIFVNAGYWTSADGHTFVAGDPPCTSDQVPDIGAIRATEVVALCSYDPGTGFMHKDLRRSVDGGPFQAAGTAPDAGLTDQYVSPAPKRNVITAVGGASILYRSTADGWETPVFLPDALPWADLQFVDRQHGYVVWGGPRSGSGEVYRTGNGGRSWTVLDLP
jgi:hypothetical protein